jgi:hypothetical protein
VYEEESYHCHALTDKIKNNQTTCTHYGEPDPLALPILIFSNFGSQPYGSHHMQDPQARDQKSGKPKSEDLVSPPYSMRPIQDGYVSKVCL